MKKTALSPELKAVLKRLKLGAIIDTLPDRTALAEKDRTPIQDFLLMILGDEVSRRDAAATACRSAALSATPSSGGSVASLITTTSAAPAGALAAKPIARSALFVAVAGATPDPVMGCAIAAGARASDRQAERSRLFMRMIDIPRCSMTWTGHSNARRARKSASTNDSCLPSDDMPAT